MTAMTMTAEDVASQLGRRPGYRLLTYREVGLPFWDVPLKCRFLARKDLPAPEEFTLRCVESGLQISREIQDFLGLPPRVVEAVMGSLVVSGYLAPQVDHAGAVRYVLTGRGEVALREASQIVPEEKTVRLAYDGLTRKFLYVDRSLRWRPQDLRSNDLLEIPAFPVDPPEVDPSMTSSVAPVIRAETEQAGQELIAVLDLDGRREKFFQKAVALIFQPVDQADEIIVQFAIDGRLSEEHSHAFARAEGKRKLGVMGLLREDDDAIREILGPAVASQIANEDEVAALRHATDGFRGQLNDLARQSSKAQGEQRERLRTEAEEIEQRIDEAEAALSRLPVRLLEVHEHPALLAEALSSAQERLLIVSPWIREAVVDDSFVAAIESLLRNGVHVAIAYGIDDGKKASERDMAAEQRLRHLATGYPQFRFVRLGDTHAKILVVDQRFVVVTSYNWLSFKGDPSRPFRDERGTLVSLVPEIDRIYQNYIDRMSK